MADHHDRRPARAAWLLVHRWLGLVLGGVLALICLSGIAVSYWHEIENLLHPAYRPLPAKADRLPLNQLAVAATAACQGCGPITEIGPGSAADIVTVYFHPAPPGRVDEVVLDPPTGRVLASDRGADQPVSILYRFHSALFAGTLGRWIVGALGAALCASVASGLWLWWPRTGLWRWAITVRSPRGGLIGFAFDAHKALGVVVAAALLIAGLTGIALGFPKMTTRTLVATLGGGEPMPALAASHSDAPPSLDRLVSIARKRFPRGQWSDLDLPDAPNQPAAVTLKQPGEFTKYGDTKVWVDRASGAILGVRDGLRMPSAVGVQAYLTYLHSGTVFGEIVRALFAAAAAAPAFLFLSGAWLWARRRFVRSVPHHRRQPGDRRNGGVEIRPDLCGWRGGQVDRAQGFEDAGAPD